MAHSNLTVAGPSVDVDTIYSNLKDLFTPGEFEQELDRVQGEFFDLIDRETAALYIAVEAGRNEIEERTLDSLNDADQVTISVTISRIDTLRTFSRKDGTSGQVQSLYVTRDGHEIRVSLWDSRDIDQLQSGDVREGMAIKVINGRVKINNYGTTVNVGNYTKVVYSN